MSNNLKVSHRANISSTEITVFIYTDMQIFYFCSILNILSVYKMYGTNTVNIFKVNRDEM